MLKKSQQLITLLLCLAIAGCSSTPPAKPLDSKASTVKILAKDPTSDEFNVFLVKHGYKQTHLPLKEWDIDALTLCAIFYHTKLDVARKQSALAELAIQTAGIRNNPSINADIAHSNQKNGDIKPWSYGLSVGIPIETGNKRAIRVEKVQQTAEAARMDVAETAWSLRNQMTTDLIAYYQSSNEAAVLEEELAVQTDIANMLEKRVSAGIASKTDLSNVNLLALKTEQALNAKRAKANSLKAQLAADVGLSLEKFTLLPINPLILDKTLAQQAKALEKPLASKTLQAHALLNRIDIRRSIANYAAAEAEIKLQAANQTPDITLSPGILFDFGDSIWSLGFSSLLNVLNKNTALIEEAKQLRAIEGAQFEHLQASIIAEISQADTRYGNAKQTLIHAERQQARQLEQMQKMQKQFNAGLIGKVALKKFQLNNVVAKQHLLAAKFNMLQAANQIENIMQKPLYTPFKMPNFNDKQVKS